MNLLDSNREGVRHVPMLAIQQIQARAALWRGICGLLLVGPAQEKVAAMRDLPNGR